MMNNVPSVIPSTGSLSNFLSNKEKFTGNLSAFVLTLIISIPLLVIFGPAIGGFFTMLNYTFNAIALLFFKVVMAVGVFLFFSNKTVRALLWNMRVSFSRAVTKQFIKLMPTYLLEAYANEYLVSQQSEFMGDMSYMKGLKNESTKRKEQNRVEREELMGQCEALMQRSYIEAEKRWTSDEDEMKYKVASGTIGILDKLYPKLVTQEQRLETMCKIIEKFERAFRYQIAMIQAMVKSLITEYESEKTMAAAAQKMGALTKGNIHRQIFDQTQQYVESQICQFKAYTDTFIQMAPELLTQPELENDAAAAKVMVELQNKKIIEWDQTVTKLSNGFESSIDKLSQGGNVIDMIMTTPSTAEPLPVTVKSAPVARKYSGISN